MSDNQKDQCGEEGVNGEGVAGGMQKCEAYESSIGATLKLQGDEVTGCYTESRVEREKVGSREASLEATPAVELV